MSAVVAGRLLEVGVAVSDLSAASEHFTHLLRAPISEPIEERDAFGLRFTMCRVARADFEIMQSIDTEGLVARFVARQGEGLHHIAFEIEDAQSAMQVLRQRGVPVLGGEKPVELANLKAFFIHPSCFGGMLIEFVQNLHPWLDGVAYRPRPDADGIDARRIVGLTAAVDNVDRVLLALSELLGATPSANPEARVGESGSRSCQIGDIALTLWPESASRRKGFQSVSIEVNDLDESVSRLRSLGADIRYDAGHQTVSRSMVVSLAGFHGVSVELVSDR